MKPDAPIDHLAKLADNKAFVLGAYFFAFFPWTVMSNIDYISEKWRTVQRTRKHAYIHLISSTVPMFYVALYAVAQERAGDSKEQGAALVALFFNFGQFLRNVVGITQLRAFVKWSYNAMLCLNAIEWRDSSIVSLNPAFYREEVYNNLMVNNTVIDNELGGTDLMVRISWNKVWWCLKNFEFHPTKWFETNNLDLCTVRWAGAFLCSVGPIEDYDSEIHLREPSLPSKFLADFQNVLSALNSVTWNIDNEQGTEMFSVDELRYSSVARKMERSWSRSTPYETNVGNNYFDSKFQSYEHEFESLRSSVPSDYRDLVDVGHVHCLVLLQHFGWEKLKKILHYYNNFRRHSSDRDWKQACRILHEQCSSLRLKDCDELENKYDLDSIPLFPYRFQMVQLWDKCTNRRVLQSSAHCDIKFALDAGSDSMNEFYERFAGLVFDISEDIGHRYMTCESRVAKVQRGFRYLWSGVALETIRTFLGNWLMRNSPCEPNWDPILPTNSVSVSVSNYISTHMDDERRLIWEIQCGLQRILAESAENHHNLPESTVLIILFILGLPMIQVDTNEENKISASGNSGSSCAPNHCSVNVFRKVWVLSSMLAPQDIRVSVQHDPEARKVELKLVCDKDTRPRFCWQDWVNAAMGFMSGMDGSDESNDVRRRKRLIKRRKLSSSLIICPLSKGDNESSDIPSVRIWAGWPPFDVRVCQFEFDQLNREFSYYDSNTFEDDLMSAIATLEDEDDY